MSSQVSSHLHLLTQPAVRIYLFLGVEVVERSLCYPCKRPIFRPDDGARWDDGVGRTTGDGRTTDRGAPLDLGFLDLVSGEAALAADLITA